MEKSKLGLEPAFASFQGDHFSTQVGISKRFYAACAILQGLCADPNVTLDRGGIIIATQLAYRCADELLKQENE